MAATIVTGAFGNVGRAVMGALSRQQPLGLLSRKIPPMEPLLSQPNVRAEAVDYADPSSLTRALAALRAALGPISGLVHTVGRFAAGTTLHEQEACTERELMEVNYHAALATVRATLPFLLEHGSGRIILFASADALRARALTSAYAASKAALVRAAEALAEELTATSIGITVLAPSTLDTGTNRAALGASDRNVSLDAVAAAVSYFLSPAASAIRFAVLPLGA